MRQIRASIALVAVALVACSHLGLTTRTWNLEEYIQPTADHFLDSPQYYEGRMRTTLLELHIPQNASPDDVLERLRGDHQHTNPRFRPIYELVANLADEDSACTGVLINNARIMYAHRKSTDLEPFQKFMRQFGGPKMVQCAKMLEAEFIQQPKDDYESTFDDFYKAAFNLMRVASDTELVWRLSGFNIVDDFFELSATSPVTRKYNSRFESQTPHEAATAVGIFLKQLCAAESDVKNVLMAANLAAVYSTYQLTDKRMQKLNEYNRICIAFNAQQEESEAHFTSLVNPKNPRRHRASSSRQS